ncbi:MAG: long-chain-acyl-CoA synthetase [Robiginitomaculum sp.]|nr:MAG: long-chain-acyl-CoA synthetase [Robiginitomaculum sp.]
MGLFAAIRREYLFISGMSATLKRIKHIDPDSSFLLTDEMQQAATRYSRNTAFIMGDKSWTYAQFDAYANRVAAWGQREGYGPGDTIAVFCHNRLEYVAIWYGLSKVGVIAALLNTQLVGKSLSHCLEVAQSKAVILEPELLDEALAINPKMKSPLPLWCLDGPKDGAENFDAALSACTDQLPDPAIRADLHAGDVVLKMFTSGTTGLPKAALITHTRAQRYMNTFSGVVRAGEKDRMIMVLPLYHATGGICGVGTTLLTGGALIVQKSFSASRFWDEAVSTGATLFMYVGELCRFLVNTPQTPAEHKHKIRAMIGNGLGPDVWKRFVERFGIHKIAEFYGATEGNVGLLNADGQIGAIGRIPWYARKSFNLALVKIDRESLEPKRGEDGFCIRTGVGEPGEAIGYVDAKDARFRFDGYGSKSDTNKKILRDVFKKGDVYFRTGDLMRFDKHGYYYFVDRVGDTFRWMAENVSTGEVAAAFSTFEGVSQCNVYGVEVAGHDGRAGMAAYVPTGSIDYSALFTHLNEQLPIYAVPVFLREQAEAETTATFKYRKVDLVKDGFDPGTISEPLLVLDREKGTYMPLTKTLYGKIMAGKIRL